MKRVTFFMLTFLLTTTLLIGCSNKNKENINQKERVIATSFLNDLEEKDILNINNKNKEFIKELITKNDMNYKEELKISSEREDFYDEVIFIDGLGVGDILSINYSFSKFADNPKMEGEYLYSIYSKVIINNWKEGRKIDDSIIKEWIEGIVGEDIDFTEINSKLDEFYKNSTENTSLIAKINSSLYEISIYPTKNTINTLSIDINYRIS